MGRAHLERVLEGRRDRGVVAILTALLMTVFLGFCGFAVDIGHWYLVKEQVQKAADAAALAAVVNLPDNVTNAQPTAAQYAALNGFPEVSGTTSVTTTPSATDTGSLSVTVSTTVKNFFTGWFGIPTTTISSTGDAAYTPPLKMGSPCNRMGSDPTKDTSSDSATCDSSAGGLWVNLNAPGTAKQEGDPFNTTTCTGVEDGCTGTVNDEHTTAGYFYDITVKQAGPLTVEIFDAPWVDVSSGQDLQCDSAALAGLNPTPPNTTRYKSGSTSPYCTGDSVTMPSSTAVAGSMSTTFTLRSAAGDPLTPQSHQALNGCSHPYKGYQPPDSTTFSAWLSPGNAAYDAELAGSFRKWSTLCSLSNVEPGTYVLQVESDDNVAAANRFSVRATGRTGTALSALTVAGHGSMDLFANDKSQNARFYLVRTPTSSAGQTLHVRFYDVGSCDSACTLTLLNPSGAVATGCTTTTTLPITGCSFTPDQDKFNGKWIDLLVPVPKGYTCADSDQGACWYKVKYSGGAPHDVTAWTAQMDGQPVRLVP